MIEIDFYKYKKELSVEHDLLIDTSGLSPKADATGVYINEEGDIQDVNMNEIVDEKINFIFNDEKGNIHKYKVNTEDGYDENEIAYLHEEPVVNELEQINYQEIDVPATLTTTGLSNEEDLINYPIVSIIGDGVDTLTVKSSKILTDIRNKTGNFIQVTGTVNYNTVEDKNPYYTITSIIDDFTIVVTKTPNAPDVISVSETSGTITLYPLKEYSIGIRPQHELLQEPNSSRVAIIDREIYAALGMWDTNDYKISFDKDDPTLKMDIKDSRAAGYISRKDYVIYLRNLKEKLNNIGIDVLVTEFLSSRPLGDQDVNVSGLKRSRRTKFDDAIVAGAAFLYRKNQSDILTEIDPDTISPFHMSVKEVFKAQFTPADELRDQLITIFEKLVAALNMPLGRRIFGDVIDELKKSIVINPRVQENEQGNPVLQTGGTEINNEGVEGKNYYPHGFVGNGEPIPKWELDPIEVDPVTGEGVIPINDETGESIYVAESDIEISSDVNIVDVIDDLKEVVKKIKNASALISGVFVNFALGDIRNRVNQIEDLIKKIKWYERFTNESIFANRQFLTGKEADKRLSDPSENPNRKLGRILLPVDFGIKRRRRRKWTWRGYRTVTVSKVDLGIRWVEIRFIDTRVLSQYRANETASGKGIPLDIPSTGDKVVGKTVTLITSVPHGLDETTLTITVDGADQSYYNGEFKPIIDVSEPNKISYNLLVGNGNTEITDTQELPKPTGDPIVLRSAIIPYETTAPSEEEEEVEIVFKVPHLPLDDDLRDEGFNNYGAFDQTEFSNREKPDEIEVTNNLGNTSTSTEVPAGFEIFHQSSKKIEDMRDGIDIYNKVQFLLQLLKTEFNETRVQLIETMRSWEDQEVLQVGGDPSNFLSWHNFGLSVKILITKEDGVKLIEEGSKDFFKVLRIADSFIQGAKLGHFGEPMNVIWCAQLITGPDMFVWEFLPIGTKHGDAWKYRMESYNQIDPLVSIPYINTTKRNYIIRTNDEIPDDKPYIRKFDTAYDEAILIDDDRYVSPEDINQFIIPNNLVLKDIQEFLFMVKQKMAAHGTLLEIRDKIQEWKTKNPISYEQLLIYYSIIGNFVAARGILASDYVEKFDSIVSSKADSDPVQFVRDFVGEEEYNNIKIFLSNSGDSSFITLHDGRITIPVLDVRSAHPEGSGNTFGQKQVDVDNVKFGRFNEEGVFISEDENPIPVITSENSVIAGYNDDNIPVEGDAIFLHILVKNKIVEEFKLIKELTQNLNIEFLYDNLMESPNRTQFDTLENEFGVIKTQTTFDPDNPDKDGNVLSIKELEDLFNRMNINNQNSSPTDGSVRGAGVNLESINQDIDFDTNTDTNLGAGGNKNDNIESQSVFEKLISNAQLQGIQRAKLTKEKPVIEPLQGKATIENIIKEIKNDKEPDVRDIL